MTKRIKYYSNNLANNLYTHFFTYNSSGAVSACEYFSNISNSRIVHYGVFFFPAYYVLLPVLWFAPEFNLTLRPASEFICDVCIRSLSLIIVFCTSHLIRVLPVCGGDNCLKNLPFVETIWNWISWLDQWYKKSWLDFFISDTNKKFNASN